MILELKKTYIFLTPQIKESLLLKVAELTVSQLLQQYSARKSSWSEFGVGDVQMKAEPRVTASKLQYFTTQMLMIDEQKHIMRTTFFIIHFCFNLFEQ